MLGLTLTPDQIVSLIDRWGGPLTAWLRGRCSSPEDVVQETFCRLVQQRAVPERIAPWLFRVAGNLAREEARRGKRQSLRERLVAASERRDHNAGESLERDEVRCAVHALPVELREVIIARLWGELTLSEIADALGTSVSTVHRRYEEGLTSLRQSLEPNPQQPQEYHVP